LKNGPLSLAQARLIAREAGSSWTESQIHLFLSCLDGIQVSKSTDGEIKINKAQESEEELLAAAILDLARSNSGRPLQLAAIRKLLPGKFFTTEEQIKAIAKKTAGLEVFGPGLVRLKQ
jgi:hypothetical protein